MGQRQGAFRPSTRCRSVRSAKQRRGPRARRWRAAQPGPQQHDRHAAATERECRAVRDELRRTATAYGFDKLGHLTVMWWDAVAAAAEANMAARPAIARRVGQLDVDAARSKALYRTELAGSCRRGRTRRRRLEPARRRRRSAGSIVRDRGLRCSGSTWPRWPAATAPPAVRRSNGCSSRRTFVDNWFATVQVLQIVSAALEVGVPPEEIRQRFLTESLAKHPAAVQLAERAEGVLALAEGRTADAFSRSGRWSIMVTTSSPGPCRARFDWPSPKRCWPRASVPKR